MLSVLSAPLALYLFNQVPLNFCVVEPRCSRGWQAIIYADMLVEVGKLSHTLLELDKLSHMKVKVGKLSHIWEFGGQSAWYII